MKNRHAALLRYESAAKEILAEPDVSELTAPMTAEPTPPLTIDLERQTTACGNR